MSKVTSELLNEIVARLVDTLHPEQIYLFGSHVWGVPNEHSDLDLMVISKNESKSVFEQAKWAHEALFDLDMSKDIIVKTQADFNFFSAAHSSLSYKIATEGKLIYDRSCRQSPVGVGSTVAVDRKSVV